MPFATWWRGDPLPVLTALPSFEAQPVTGWADAQQITGLTENRILARHQSGHRLYAAFVEGTVVGYGWVARQAGGIEELDFSFDLPRANVYLWDFATRPDWRGRGVYPHLLQAIVRQEIEHGIDRFWIGYEAHNEASGRGISKAGFAVVGDLVVAQGRVTGVSIAGRGERARSIADLFDLPIVGDAER
jgi:GNAT superfamily N-acetyltransferase